MTELVIATFALSMVYAAAFVVVWIAWLRLHLELARSRERMHALSRRCDVMQDTLDRYHAARMDEARGREALWHSEALPLSAKRRSAVIVDKLVVDVHGAERGKCNLCDQVQPDSIAAICTSSGCPRRREYDAGIRVGGAS